MLFSCGCPPPSFGRHHIIPHADARLPLLIFKTRRRTGRIPISIPFSPSLRRLSVCRGVAIAQGKYAKVEGAEGGKRKPLGKRGRGRGGASLPPSLHRFTRGQNIFTVKEGGESGDRTKRPPPLPLSFWIPASLPSTLFSSCLLPSFLSLGWFGCFAATKRRREGRGRPRGRN